EWVELVFQRRLRQVTAEFRKQGSFFGPVGGRFLTLGAGQFFAQGGEAQSALVQNLSRRRLVFPQQAEQQVFRPDMFVRKALRFFRRVGQHPLAFLAEGEIHRSRAFLPNRRAPLDLLTNGLDGGVRAEESVGERL